MSGELNVSILEKVRMVLQGRQRGGDQEAEKTQDVLLDGDRSLSLRARMFGNDGTRDRIIKTNTDRQVQIEIVGDGKILGTAAPSADTNTNIYTVPAATTAKLGKLWAVNRGTAPAKVRIGIDVGGNGTDAPSTAEWVYYDLKLKGNTTLTLDGEFWLAALDDLVAYTDVATVAFGASGVEYA